MRCVKREVVPSSRRQKWVVFSLLELFPTLVSMDTIFVALFPATLEAVSCKVHKSLCTSEFTATSVHALTLLVLESK